VIENLIHPKDLTSMRENFLRKKKLPIFSHAFLDGGIAALKGGPLTIEPSSLEARYAGLRSPLKN
jgi:hypothetical protein